MGAVNFSIDAGLLGRLKEALPLTTFVETGTFEGASVALARPYFKALHTVELSAEHYAKAADRFREDPAVEVRLGDSVTFLRALAPRLEKTSTLYWLDAHWCAAEGASSGRSECPLLGELEAIGRLNGKSVVVIDDARLFMCAPPKTHKIGEWPTFDAVLRGLRKLSEGHELTVVNDVMVFTPQRIGKTIRRYAQEWSVDWLVIMDKSRNYETLRTQLAESEGDRRARLDTIESMSRRLETSEADRAARLEALEELEGRLRESEADRAARLKDAEELADRLKEVEADRAARLEALEELEGRLRESEADRAARLKDAEELAGRLKEVEADRAARLGAIQRLESALRESEVDRAERLNSIRALEGLLAEAEKSAEDRHADSQR